MRFRWLAAIALLASLLGLGAPPASAATYQVTCSTSGFGCATGGYGPQNLGWPDNYYGQNWQAGLVHNCTRYAAFKLQQNGLGDPGSSFGNAYQWDDRVRAKFGADKVNGTPSVGAIAQWDSFPGDGGFGHVAYVEEVGADYIRVTDDAYGGGTTAKIIPVGHARWPSSFIHLGRGGPITDGTFVSHGGHVYRIAGGAPIWVSDWARVGGPQPTRALSDAEFASLRYQPADGTFISSPPPPAGRGEIYRIAGGAPIYVTYNWWKTMNPAPPVIQVDQYAIDAAGQGGLLNHLNFRPADGTFVGAPGAPAGRGEIYRIAGGAPIYVTYNWWKTMNPTPPVTTISQEAIDQAGQSGVWSHLNHKPAEGTFVGTPGAPAGRGEIFRIAGGAPIYVTYNWWKTLDPKPPVTQISQEAVDQAGQPGAWSHLNYRPADGTYISSPGAPAGRGEVYRMAGGAPLYVSLAWWKTLKPTPSPVVVSQEAIDQANQPGAWSHMRYYPADDTLVSANGDSYLIKAAVPRRITPPKGGLPIDPAVIANAGKPGVWSHLKAPAVTPDTQPAPPSNAAPRRAISGVKATMKSKRRVLLRWKAVDGATRYGVDLKHGHHRLGTSSTRPRIVLKVKPGVRYTAIISVVQGATDVQATKYRFRAKR